MESSALPDKLMRRMFSVAQAYYGEDAVELVGFTVNGTAEGKLEYAVCFRVDPAKAPRWRADE
jgi:hypothetical protein